jgi:hypothetical protein
MREQVQPARNDSRADAGRGRPRRPALALLAAWSMMSMIPVPAQARRLAIQLWKDPNCGCCSEWVSHLQAHGFSATVFDEGNTAARSRLAMPKRYASCHTALIEGYVVEGHVPAADILRLLNEKPVALGLAVPGMPIGSPGMDGPEYGARRDAYQVLLIHKNGVSTVFNTYR